MTAAEERIPVTIIAGYLGVGKTTVINHVLAQPDGAGLAVLVNDFGAINIDVALIANRDGETISLSNGCVCCSIADDLGAALDQVLALEPRPKKILLEASGVADPNKIAYYARGWPGLSLDAVITLVETERSRQLADDKFVGPTVVRQIQAADLLVLSKTDLTTEGQRRQDLEWLDRHAAGIPRQAVQHGALAPALLFAPVTNSRPRPRENNDHHHHDDYLSFVWRSDQPLQEASFRAIFQDPVSGLLRAKGFVSFLEGERVFQLVGGRFEFDEPPATRAAATEIVFIGIPGQLDEQHLCASLAESRALSSTPE
jgi:G3E family GTPase